MLAQLDHFYNRRPPNRFPTEEIFDEFGEFSVEETPIRWLIKWPDVGEDNNREHEEIFTRQIVLWCHRFREILELGVNFL